MMSYTAGRSSSYPCGTFSATTEPLATIRE
jgi:hypothetical protein